MGHADKQLLYLQASGPCVDDLRYDVEPAGQDRAQGPTGDVGQRFADWLGPLVTHADTLGTATVRLTLDCPAGTYCADTGALLASLTLTVASTSAPDATPGTSLPASLSSTLHVTRGSTLASSVSTGPALPAAGETVTVTLEPTR